MAHKTSYNRLITHFTYRITRLCSNIIHGFREVPTYFYYKLLEAIQQFRDKNWRFWFLII